MKAPTNEDRAYILAARQRGLSFAHIAQQSGFNEQTVRGMCPQAVSAVALQAPAPKPPKPINIVVHPSSLRILLHLSDSDQPMTAGRVARRMDISQKNMIGRLMHLHDLGLVHATESRPRLWSITQKGRTVLCC